MSAPYFFRWFVAPTCTDDDGLPIQYRWIGGPEEAVCIGPRCKCIYARIWHDGYGKFYPTIYVSLAQAIRQFGKSPIVSVKFQIRLSFAIELYRLKCSCMEEAIEKVEAFIKEHEVI